MKEPIKKVALKSGRTRYRVIVDVGRKADGTRDQRCATFDTRKEARSWLSGVRAEVGKGTFVKPTKETLNEHLDQWLAGRATDGTLRPATLTNYGDALRPARALLGHRPIQAITAEDVDRLKAAMLTGTLRSIGGKNRPLSPRSVNLTLTVLSMALDQAVRRGKVQTNNASPQMVDRVKGAESQVGEAWTSPEVATFKAAIAGERLHAAWLLTLNGLRRGEVLGLRWSDVDLITGTLSIRQARVLAHRQVVIGPPKTKRGVRDLPLPTDVWEALRALRKQQVSEQVAAGGAYAGGGPLDPLALVVVNELGEPTHPEQYGRDWRRLTKAAGLPVIRLHDARHTSVSHMRAQGLPDHLVARWHGHDEAVMRRTYTHTTTADLLALAGRSSEAV